MTTTSSPRRATIDSFYTCVNAAHFKIDWRAFYERAQQRTDEVRARWPHELDISYGPSVRHRLDLYLPVDPIKANSLAPVLLFLHGGGFREGDPTLYGYLAEPYLERGIAFGTLGYRLTPESHLPETYADVELALAWCAAHLASRGVDPSRIVLAGHSAGAILAAQLAVRSDWLTRRNLPADLLKAAVLISGPYDFTDPTSHAEFFTDPAQRAAASPLLNVERTPPPLVVACGSLENSSAYATDSQRLVETARSHGGQAELLTLEGLDHADTVTALADQHSPLFQSVARLI